MPKNPLKIDVQKVFNGEVKEIPFDFTFVPEQIEDLDLCFEEPVNAGGKVYEKARGNNRAESYVELVFHVDGTYKTHCARCAKELQRKFHSEHTYGVTKALHTDSDDIIEATGGFLDVQELAQTAFYLELPTKVLCREDCQGLCPVCGKDLNEGPCSCKKNIGANTLEDLKKLLDK